MKAVVLFILTAAALATSPAWADDTYSKCLETSDGTNTAWAECGGERIKRAEKDMAIVWKELYSNYEGEEAAALKDEQEAWIAFKEKSCLLYSTGYFGREGQVLEYPICRAELIERRTKELKNYFSR